MQMTKIYERGIEKVWEEAGHIDTVVAYVKSHLGKSISEIAAAVSLNEEIVSWAVNTSSELLKKKSEDIVVTTLEKMLFMLEDWSEPQEEMQLTDNVAPGTDVSLPSVAITDLPVGATIVKAIAMFKFRVVENTHIGVNKLQGEQHIQVRNDTPGTWQDAISFVDNMFTIAASTREGGISTFMGDHNIVVEVDGNDTYNFQWAASLVDQANLQFNDVQTGLRIWYSI